ncbi:short-chain dehydrogenase [Burkholderia pseudomallei]|uniref:short-chain dehydrogenase n=1 Tax=Burkholderia pseudomallei TaxID=28450 RepID=UPI0028BEF6C4|nr:short-chain dehydrogenase [Burkholderia pseudomallei]
MNTPLSFSMFARRPRASLVRPKRHALERRAAAMRTMRTMWTIAAAIVSGV